MESEDDSSSDYSLASSYDEEVADAYAAPSEKMSEKQRIRQ